MSVKSAIQLLVTKHPNLLTFDHAGAFASATEYEAAGDVDSARAVLRGLAGSVPIESRKRYLDLVNDPQGVLL